MALTLSPARRQADAAFLTLEFFTSQVRNAHTRQVYGRREFSAFCQMGPESQSEVAG